MLARTPSTVRLIGAGLTSLGAAAAFLFAPAGKAQTLATLDTDINAQRAAAMAVCDSIRDDVQRVGCRGQASIDFDIARTAAAKQRIETAKQGIASEEQLQRCGEFLRGKRDGEGVVFDRRITRDNMCPYARELGMRDGPG